MYTIRSVISTNQTIVYDGNYVNVLDAISAMIALLKLQKDRTFYLVRDEKFIGSLVLINNHMIWSDFNTTVGSIYHPDIR